MYIVLNTCTCTYIKVLPFLQPLSNNTVFCNRYQILPFFATVVKYYLFLQPLSAAKHRSSLSISRHAGSVQIHVYVQFVINI